MDQITFTFQQVLSLLQRQRELAFQDAWKLYEEAVHVEDGLQYNRHGFFQKINEIGREPDDITTLKKYINEVSH